MSRAPGSLFAQHGGLFLGVVQGRAAGPVQGSKRTGALQASWQGFLVALASVSGVLWRSLPSSPVRPNTSLKGEHQRHATRPRAQVRCTFSVLGAWRHAVGAPLAQTLGLTKAPIQVATIPMQQQLATSASQWVVCASRSRLRPVVRLLGAPKYGAHRSGCCRQMQIQDRGFSLAVVRESQHLAVHLRAFGQCVHTTSRPRWLFV